MQRALSQVEYYKDFCFNVITLMLIDERFSDGWAKRAFDRE